MKPKPFVPSGEWIAYFYENAQVAEERRGGMPPALGELPAEVRGVIAGSLPAWQLGEASDGRHLRAAARQYALAHEDMAFLSAVGIPRKGRDWGDSLFRCCRYAIPNYAVWASVVVMVESMAEIYYAAVRRVSPCTRLQAECEGILRDEVKHIQFQCEHLAAGRRGWPRGVRGAVRLGEAAFYAVVCTAVWIAHGRLLRFSGLGAWGFARAAAAKFRMMGRWMDPERYVFPEAARTASDRGPGNHGLCGFPG